MKVFVATRCYDDYDDGKGNPEVVGTDQRQTLIAAKANYMRDWGVEEILDEFDWLDNDEKRANYPADDDSFKLWFYSATDQELADLFDDITTGVYFTVVETVLVDDYQTQANRTAQNDQYLAAGRCNPQHAHRIVDALFGLFMAGATADALKKTIFYGKSFDVAALFEEESQLVKMSSAYHDAVVNGFKLDPEDADLLHAILGLISELYEFAWPIAEKIFLGKKIDEVNVHEELGDINWYRALAATALDAKLWQIDAKNIAKLKRRYPDVFSEKHATDRDLAKEREALREDN